MKFILALASIERTSDNSQYGVPSCTQYYFFFNLIFTTISGNSFVCFIVQCSKWKLLIHISYFNDHLFFISAQYFSIGYSYPHPELIGVRSITSLPSKPIKNMKLLRGIIILFEAEFSLIKNYSIYILCIYTIFIHISQYLHFLASFIYSYQIHTFTH